MSIKNYEVLGYKVGMVEDYLGIQRVHASSTREEKKKEEENVARDIFPTNFAMT